MRVDNTMIHNNNDNSNDTAAAATTSTATATNDGGGDDGGNITKPLRLLLARRPVQLQEFLSLEVPHPYGVQPEGNRFLQVTTTKTEATSPTTTTLSSPTHLLTDECWNSVLQFCNGIDLARVGQTCRYFYVSSHLPELWRDLVLHKMHHHNADNANNNTSKDAKSERKEKVLEHFYHSWKDTYIRCYLSMDCNPQDALQKLEKLHPHHPMQVAGIYSDFLYRLHTCRSFAIPEEWLTCATKQQQHGDEHLYDNQGLVPRINARDMDVQRFQDEYENANFPVVIAGGAADWKATQQWHQLSYLLQMATIHNPPPVYASTNTTTSNSSNGVVGSMAAAIAAAAASNTSPTDDSAVLKRQAAPDQPPSREEHQEPMQKEQLEHSHYHGQMTFRATSGTAPLPATFTLPAYLDYCETSETNLMEEAPLYLFDRSSLIQPIIAAGQAQGALAPPHYACFDDFRPCLARTCPYWDSQISPQHDLFRLLGEGARPDHTWLIIGARRSGSVFHIDPNATHAWNATIVGRKRWIFYPPTSAATGIYSNSGDDENDHMPPPGVYPSPDGDSVALPLSVGEWLQQFWPEHCRRMRQYSFKQQQGSKDTVQQHQHFLRPLECTTGAGDIVFVPHGWWHTVINLDEINIAITHNYVSGGDSSVGAISSSSSSKMASAASDNPNSSNSKQQKNKHSNLPDVLRFLRDKRNQVSGCRDRPNEAIQPDCLHEEFVAALQRHYPAMLDFALKVVQQQEQWEHERHNQQSQEQGKSRGMFYGVNGRRHQERKKRHREKLYADDDSATCKKKSSSTTADDDGDHEDTSIMAKGKSENDNGNFSFSFF